MSELLVLRRPRPPAIVPPLLSFTAGFIDSFTVLALFGLFVAQVTGSFVLTAVAIVTNEPGAADQAARHPGRGHHRPCRHARAPRPRRAGMGVGTGMRGADRLAPDSIDRRAARRSQRCNRDGGEPARPVRHGHAER